MIADILIDGFWAALAGIGFGSISNPPKRAFLYIAILAAIGHAFRFYLMKNFEMDIATASFCASLSIGGFSLIFGLISHCPITVLYIPALLPMVPGMYAYKSVFELIKFMKTLNSPDLSVVHLQAMLSNVIVTFSTVFLLALGATLFIFMFPKKAYSMTRK